MLVSTLSVARADRTGGIGTGAGGCELGTRKSELTGGSLFKKGSEFR